MRPRFLPWNAMHLRVVPSVTHPFGKSCNFHHRILHAYLFTFLSISHTHTFSARFKSYHPIELQAPQEPMPSTLSGSLNRPAKRSTPISQILGAKDRNVPGNLPSKKRQRQPLHSIIDSTPLKRKHLGPIIPSKVELESSLTTPSAFRHQAATPKFKILTDSHVKTPLSDLVQRSVNKKAYVRSHNVKHSTISQKVSAVDFMQQTHIPKRKLESVILPEHQGLLKDAHLPLMHLNNWFKLHTPNVLTKSHEGTLQTVGAVRKLNDMLMMVTIDNEDILLLNYDQSLPSFNRIQQLRPGDQVRLIQHFQVSSILKLYYDWKLLV